MELVSMGGLCAATIRKIERILADFIENSESDSWIEENIPKAAADKFIKTLIALEIVETVEEAIRYAGKQVAKTWSQQP
ncbi:hypothetical protein P7H17_16570 [Paenibacillus larvae]|nr:hypothetical protein [Paenibacillus larvae]MDT2287322.1 hypothetical protein [Paenibacillus larvae]